MLNKLLPENSKRRIFAKKIYNKYFAKYSEEERIYKKWIEKNEPNKNELEKQRNEKFKINPKISIVVPVYNTPEDFFQELVESLQNQTYPNWELCLADGSPESLKFMQEYPKKDDRIKYKIIGENKGISGNTNEALSLVTGDYIGLLDHDDLLPAFSLYEVVKVINENPEVEFIYTDEDKLETAKGPRYGVFFKPDFSPYTLNSANYICHFSIFKKELMDKLQGFRSKYDGSQDFDIVARASEETKNIVHIPKVLYHWRAHKNSTASNSDSKPYAFEVGKQVIKDHIKRSLDTDVEVTDGLTAGSYEVKYEVKGMPKVSIILDAIGLENSQIEELLKKIRVSSYKNYEIILLTNKNESELKNVADIDNIKVAFESESNSKAYNNLKDKIDGEYFIIFDGNLKNIAVKDYIQDLVGICQDKTVGIVGTKLYNSKNLVEHAGIVIGMNGVGDFVYKGALKDIGTYMQRLLIIHNVSAVLLKYSMIDKKVWESLGGFSVDTSLKSIENDIDYCLKLLKDEKQVVINPIVSFEIKELDYPSLTEDESKNFMKKWNEEYKCGDRYFSPNLSKNSTGICIGD